MKVGRDAFIKQSNGSHMPSMFLGPGDMVINNIKEVLALTCLYSKGRVNGGEKKERQILKIS